MLYRFEIVGGPYDGAPGMKWCDDGEHPCPDRIWIGRCRGNGECGIAECGAGTAVAHVAFWTSREAVPVRSSEYEKEIEFVERDEGAGCFSGVARYAIGGLGLLPCESLEDVVPAGAMAGAGVFVDGMRVGTVVSMDYEIDRG